MEHAVIIDQKCFHEEKMYFYDFSSFLLICPLAIYNVTPYAYVENGMLLASLIAALISSTKLTLPHKYSNPENIIRVNCKQ